MKKSGFLIFIIIILAALIRFFKFTSTLNMGTDQSMAYLLANHILKYGHLLLVGPLTTFWEINLLPPTYYYLITFLYWLLKNEILVSLTFNLAGISAVYLIYLLAKELYDKKSALLASLLFSFSFPMIEYSRDIWEPHLVPLFVIISFYYLILFSKRSKLIYYHLSVIAIMFSLMYVSSFIILPPFIWLLFKALIKYFKSKFYSFIYLIMSFTAYFLFNYLPVLIYEAGRNFPSLNFLISALKGDTRYLNFSASYLINLLVNVNLFFKSALNSPNDVFTWFIIILIIFNLILFRNSGSYKYGISKKLMLFIIIPFILSGFYQEKPEIYRFSSLFPLIYILFGFQLKKLSANSYLIITILITYFFCGMILLQNQIIQRNGKLFTHGRRAVQAMLNNSDSSFFIYVITPYEFYNHHGTSYYYALEKILNKNMSEFNDRGNWINQDFKTGNIPVFLVCKDFANYDTSLSACLDYFTAKYRLKKTGNGFKVDNAYIFRLLFFET